MRTVIGVGLVMGGFLLIYMAITGQLPSANSVNVKGATGGGPVATPAVVPGSGALGLPTMQHLHDVNASLGGMQ